MYAKGGKGSAVPSDSQAREKLALYVYEYLLHVGAQKSAQTFLSEVSWPSQAGTPHSQTLPQPPHPGGLPTPFFIRSPVVGSGHALEAECWAGAGPTDGHPGISFQDYSVAAAPSPVMGSMAPSDAMASGPMAPGFFQGPPGSQPSPHNPNAPMMGPHVQPFMSPRFPGGPRPTLRMPSQGTTGLSPGATTVSSRGPGVRGPWASPSGNSIPYSSSSPGSYSGPPGGGGPPGTPIMPSPGDSTNSSENMYTIMNPIGPGAGRANFPLGPGPEGPMAAMSAMEPHHVNGSLGEWASGDTDTSYGGGGMRPPPNSLAGPGLPTMNM
ncbi:PREDICTED: single-stranded DNA-binding protein 4 [Bison bison bison]|uniref:Single-stranded DNA-binding protein 4 n=1 Tax=Bison bison bison TaxID=43346 RepID=A0A6P3HSM8_BISBB|nr:PREDICTED: single-stranded DNA-binding protein 4 [Bison bison bison]